MYLEDMRIARLILLINFLLPIIVNAQDRYAIIIDELMADPTPQVGLPNNEWIELKNVSAAPINLQNWRIGDLTGQSGPLPNYILLPDSFVIICSGSAVVAMSAFGTAIPVTGFPSLDNDGDQIFLKAANGKMIHAIGYSSSWYQNELKRDGGWTLEMIDTKSPCSGSNNWKASIHTSGGTAGKKNSIDGVMDDLLAPRLLRAYTTDSITIVLVYDEPVDSLSGATSANYLIDGGLSLSGTTTMAPMFNLVQLKTTIPLVTNTVYTITANNVKDCKNNPIGSFNMARVGLPGDAVAGDWIINEILFNPRPNGYDFIEFYNNSTKIFDASKLSIANRNSNGVIGSIKALSSIPFYVFPGDHLVITEDPDNLALNYLLKNPDLVIALSSPPSFPDDEGTVVALNFQGDVVDEVNYKSDWHFKLIDNEEGISLERIDPNALSQQPDNWHSAASTNGYGTPTFKNSQFKQPGGSVATIEINPLIFSPDNDGRDDISTIQYQLTEPGWVANVIIFDGAGRPVRNLVANGTLAIEGYWNWDGLDDKGSKLPVGTYVIFTEIFNLQGKKERFKNVVVLARPLK